MIIEYILNIFLYVSELIDLINEQLTKNNDLNNVSQKCLIGIHNNRFL
jgi:hypothetical protein